MRRPEDRPQIIEADLTWTDDGFQAGIQILVDEGGEIRAVGSKLGECTERLRAQALLPSMVNAHSHAFQRGLRGKTERFDGEEDDFWSWREQMYALVSRLDAEAFYKSSLQAFREMIHAGITSVGEFHYVHHLDGEHGYELDAAVVDAASDAGIRLVLLDACYLTGDVGVGLSKAQRRFDAENVESFLESVERLQSSLKPRQGVGLVAHSVRAVPLEDIVRLHEEALERGLVFHMHVEEQDREIEASLEHYGDRPLSLLLENLNIGPEFTAVHCTHSQEEDVVQLIEAGANICLCPLTEANLGDGVAPEAVSVSDASLCLGSDSNLRIDFIEEMRLLEYGGRLISESRGVYALQDGRLPERLWHIATAGGARSLALPVGRIQEGNQADFLTVDLEHPGLADVEADDLLSAFIFGGSAELVRQVAVAGEWLR